jgi:uncharacterized damage-inducible protein DinB
VNLLSDTQFTHPMNYSHGSVRDQIVHLMSADDYWFSGLRNVPRPEPLDPADFDDRDLLRARWDLIEQNMRDYLEKLQDNMLFEKPFRDGEDEELPLWMALLHVANHGTDHRAQILRLLNDLGIQTSSQDYIFYIYGDT